MLELWLVRHGETTRNRDGRLAGWADVRLTEIGRAQAAALRPVLEGQRFDAVWCSPLTRARTTARLAWGRATPEERLKEINFGELEGTRWERLAEEHRAALLAWRDFRPPGGETLEQLAARLHGFLADLPAGRHLLFTHGGAIRLLTRELGQDAFAACASVTVVDWAGRRILRQLGGLLQ